MRLNVWRRNSQLSIKTTYVLAMSFFSLLTIRMISYIMRKAPFIMTLSLQANYRYRVSETKFLGVWIDEKLNWKKHVECVKRNLSRVVGIIYRARHILGTENLLTLYYSLFLPILSYCCEIWGITYTSTIHCIDILQKRVIRLISAVNRQCHTNILFSMQSSKIQRFS